MNKIKKRKFKIAICSGKGGVGKSMLSSSLVWLFSKKYKIVAVDCDVDAPNLAIWLGKPMGWDKIIPVITSSKAEINYDRCNNCGTCVKACKFGAIEIKKNKFVINPFLCEGCGACKIVCSFKAIKLKPVKNGEIRIKKISNKNRNFQLVSGQLLPGESGSGKIIDIIKQKVEEFNYEMMIIDSAPGTGCPVTSAIKDVDFIILITEPTVSGFSDMKRTFELIDYFKIPYRVVINKWDINIEKSEEIKKWAGKNFLGEISYDKEIFKAIANLNPIMETNLKAKKEIKEIFNKLAIF